MRREPVIAILNGATEVLELTEEYLRSEGFLTITAIVTEFKKGRRSFPEFMEKHDPTIILYDVPPPYEENMTFFRLLMEAHFVQDRCVIFTTTNKAQLEKLTGEKAAVEIVGKPYDLDILVKVVRDRLRNCA